MRTGKLKLLAVLAVAGLVGAGAGAGFALGQRSGIASATHAQPEQPLPKADPNAVTAFPDLQPKDLADLFAKCPGLFGEQDVVIDPKDPTLVRLQKARLNTARAELKVVIQLWRTAALSVSETENVMVLCDRAVYAAAELYTDPKDLQPWFEERVRVARWYEKETESQVRARIERASAVHTARFARLDAEIALLRLIERQKNPPPIP
ncbi:MAG TPA: hypothetical protein VKE74_25470 [Gemmataceae bacterium]|nr:hypothetical protein [Gemmataceae bacterium]